MVGRKERDGNRTSATLCVVGAHGPFLPSLTRSCLFDEMITHKFRAASVAATSSDISDLPRFGILKHGEFMPQRI